MFIAFPYIYYVIALRNVYDLITKETSGQEEQEDVWEDIEYWFMAGLHFAGLDVAEKLVQFGIYSTFY